MSFTKKSNFMTSNTSVVSSTSTSAASVVSNLNSAAKPAFLEVIDPINRTGKITIPIEYIEETRGMNELTRPKDAKDLSLCLLFQKGRCNAGARCHQIHADAAFVNKLRQQASTGSACCALHGDFNSLTYVTAGLTVEVLTNGVATKYALQAFGRTSTMDSLIDAAQRHFSKNVRVNSNKICRLHSQSRCKFGKDCKNVHMCPNAKPATASDIPAPLSGFAPQVVEKKEAPAGSSYLKTASRQMKSTPMLDVSRSELMNSSSSCGLSCTATPGAAITPGTFTAPATPADKCEASTRSGSVESGSNLGLSSPDESPKEKSFTGNGGSSLFDRCASNTGSPAPAPVATSPNEQSVCRSLFADSADAVFTPKKAVAAKKAVKPLSTASLTATAPAATAPVVCWDRTAALKTTSTYNPLVDAGFDQSAMTTALMNDLTNLTCSPMVSPAAAGAFAQ